MNTILIRHYHPRDRTAVRTICCDTGDKGEPCDSFFPDRELFADMWTAYYTDFEPQHCWIAEVDGQVSGYLLSSFRETAFRWRQFFWVLPKAGLRGLARGSFFTAQMRSLIWKNIFSSTKGQQKIITSLTGQIGHVHTNIHRDFRGQKLGEQLIRACLQQAETAGLKWLTAGVRADNPSSQNFFEKQGFSKVAEHPGFYIPERSATRIAIIEYGFQFK